MEYNKIKKYRFPRSEKYNLRPDWKGVEIPVTESEKVELEVRRQRMKSHNKALREATKFKKGNKVKISSNGISIFQKKKPLNLDSSGVEDWLHQIDQLEYEGTQGVVDRVIGTRVIVKFEDGSVVNAEGYMFVVV